MIAKKIKDYQDNRIGSYEGDLVVNDCRRIFNYLRNSTEEFHPKTICELTKKMIWMLSEINGKYNVRYRSFGIVQAIKNDPSQKVIVEHVEPRAFIRKKIDNDECDFNELLGHLNTCLVTPEEHTLLHRTEHKNGWHR